MAPRVHTALRRLPLSRDLFRLPRSTAARDPVRPLLRRSSPLARCYWGILSDRIMSDWEKSLLSLEKLDRSSPELWPEAIPGVTEYAARNSLSNATFPKQSLTSLNSFDEEDNSRLNYYSGLSTEALINEVKRLQDTAYRLGLEEAKEMTRGRFLNILMVGKRKRQ